MRGSPLLLCMQVQRRMRVSASHTTNTPPAAGLVSNSKQLLCRRKRPQQHARSASPESAGWSGPAGAAARAPGAPWCRSTGAGAQAGGWRWLWAAGRRRARDAGAVVDSHTTAMRRTITRARFMPHHVTFGAW
jgi:hypothetical protein